MHPPRSPPGMIAFAITPARKPRSDPPSLRSTELVERRTMRDGVLHPDDVERARARPRSAPSAARGGPFGRRSASLKRTCSAALSMNTTRLRSIDQDRPRSPRQQSRRSSSSRAFVRSSSPASDATTTAPASSASPGRMPTSGRQHSRACTHGLPRPNRCTSLRMPGVGVWRFGAAGTTPRRPCDEPSTNYQTVEFRIEQ